MMEMRLNMTEPVHRATCRVIYGDTDSGGVVYHAAYLRFFETGRTEFMRSLVVPYRELLKQGLILPVVECYIRYKAPAVYDDLLVIETSLAEIKNVSCRFHYRIYKNIEGGRQPKLLVKGFTVHAPVDEQGKLSKVPEDVLEKLKEIRPHTGKSA